MKNILIEAAGKFYAGEESDGVEKILSVVKDLGGIPGIAEWVNPLFDAIERTDYLYAADIVLHEIVPLIA